MDILDLLILKVLHYEEVVLLKLIWQKFALQIYYFNVMADSELRWDVGTSLSIKVIHLYNKNK